jgi:hypothetical protein
MMEYNNKFKLVKNINNCIINTLKHLGTYEQELNTTYKLNAWLWIQISARN